MSDVPSYDTQNLEALRQDLKDLRARAQKTTPANSTSARKPSTAVDSAAQQLAGSARPESNDRGKQLARRMLTMLERSADDESALLPGTTFTEQGVRRLLRHLAAPPSAVGPAAGQALTRLYQFVTARGPNARGGAMIAGVSVENVKRLSRLLQQIEKDGWGEVQSRLSRQIATNAERAEIERMAAIELPADPAPPALTPAPTRTRKRRQQS